MPTDLTDLRDKVAEELCGISHETPYYEIEEIADAILALPEIAEALALKREIESPSLPPLTNKQVRAALDRIMLKPHPA